MYLLMAMVLCILGTMSDTTDVRRMYLLFAGMLIIIDLLGVNKKILKEDKEYDDKNS